MAKRNAYAGAGPTIVGCTRWHVDCFELSVDMSTMGTWRIVVLWGSLLGVGCGDSAMGVGDPEDTTAESTSAGTTDQMTSGTGTGGSSSDETTTAGADSSGESTGADACATDVEATDRIVLTTRGPVEGTATERGTMAFLGIPYVAVPIGDARWMPPLEPACWSDTVVADAFGPQCPQLESEDGPVIGNEDCLHLNVWTPAADDSARPIMVFIHGGGNAVGSASDPFYDGARLASAGEQVVVTFNYRLGALGWLTEPSLPAVNLGLRDQIAALRWVRDNAAAFGGDPDRVTVFGESAGAVNTCTLLGAPEAAGLFARAIVQSGACNHRSGPVYAEQMSVPFVQSSGCGDTDDPLQCLRALPADSVVALEPTGYPSVGGLGGQGWGPSIDPDTLPMQTLDAMEAGVHNDVPLIIGANAEETWNSVPQVITEAAYVALVTATFGPTSGTVLQEYPVGNFDQVFPGIRYPTTPADEQMRDTMQGLWSSFAAGALSSDPAWPEYDVRTDSYLRLEVPVTAGEGVRTSQCDFWEGFTGG